MKYLFKLCYWILRFQRKPMFIRIHAERIKDFKFQKAVSKKNIVHYGDETIDGMFMKDCLEYLISAGVLKIEKQPHEDSPDNYTKYTCTLRIIE